MKKLKEIYFIGIGGIGMSAIARYYNSRGVNVSGYDKTETALTRALMKEGMSIHFDENIEAIPKDVDLVIYTPAIPQTHTELSYVKAHNIPLKKRAEVLGLISQEMKCLAIAGTHGKTTTTTILTHLLKVGGVDCSAFLGGISEDFQSNYVHGESEYVVVEADEYDRSFLHLYPHMAAILSMDADHLDIYGDHETMLETGFLKFAQQVDSQLFVRNELNIHFSESIGTFGINNGLYRAEQIRVEDGFFTFDLKSPVEDIDGLQLALPGRHNIENSTAAIAIAQSLGVRSEAIRKALLTFKGIKRRFDVLYRSETQAYIDDYAHHPTELNAAIGAAKELFPNKKITGVFQPHLYSRTQDFQAGFASALSQLDEVILLDIYPAREAPIPGVTSQIVFDEINHSNKILIKKEQLMEELTSRVDMEIVMTLGAGDIDIYRDEIVKMLEYNQANR